MTTDTKVQDIPKEMDDIETAQTVEEFKRMRQLGINEDVPEDLIAMYKKYEKQRSILGINGKMHPIEKLQMSMSYDFANKDYTLPKPKPVDDGIFNPQKTEEPVAEEEDDKELVEPEDDYTYTKGEKVGAKFQGTTMLGTFLGYKGENNEIVKVKIQGDPQKLEFRTMPVSDIKPYKDVDNG